jgi:hypothetical protein
VLDELLLEFLAEGDHGLEVVAPEDDGALVALEGAIRWDNKRYDSRELGKRDRGAYDEGAALVFLGHGEKVDRVQNLDAGVGVDVETVFVRAAEHAPFQRIIR